MRMQIMERKLKPWWSVKGRRWDCSSFHLWWSHVLWERQAESHESTTAAYIWHNEKKPWSVPGGVGVSERAGWIIYDAVRIWEYTFDIKFKASQLWRIHSESLKTDSLIIVSPVRAGSLCAVVKNKQHCSGTTSHTIVSIVNHKWTLPS